MTAAIHDVVVVGGGPAAWAVAGACAVEGLSTTIVGPPASGWTPTYGCWSDELEGLGLGAVAATLLDPVTVVGHRSHRLERSYSVVDNAALAGRLEEIARSTGVGRIAATVRGWRAEDDVRAVITDGDAAVRGHLVIDASGHEPALVWRTRRRAAGRVQAAVGVVARFDRPPTQPGACTLMDWRPSPGSDPARPTFLYAFDLGEGRYLAEETSLAAAPALSLGELRRRLRARLEAMGCRPLDVLREESVHIPMGLPVPPSQSIVGFGAAGGFVHPATGYSLMASMQLAPVLGRAVAGARTRGMDGDRLAEVAWQALWPPDRRRARALQEYGLGVLAGLGSADTRRFFDAFFELPPEVWAAYLSPVPELGSTVSVMRALFAAAPGRLRARLMTGDVRLLLQGSGLLRR